METPKNIQTRKCTDYELIDNDTLLIVQTRKFCIAIKMKYLTGNISEGSPNYFYEHTRSQSVGTAHTYSSPL